MLSWTLAFAAWVAVGLGEAVTVVLALALLFEFSAVLQAVPKTPKINKVTKAVILGIFIPSMCKAFVRLVQLIKDSLADLRFRRHGPVFARGPMPSMHTAHVHLTGPEA